MDLMVRRAFEFPWVSSVLDLSTMSQNPLSKGSQDIASVACPYLTKSNLQRGGRGGCGGRGGTQRN
jgi:hypothetical protein